jgi:hypothetical protein
MTLSYATLDQLKTEAASTTGTEPTGSALLTFEGNLTQYGIRASQIIDRLKNTTFAPLIDSRGIGAFSDAALSSYKLVVDPLLELTSVTLPDTTTLTVGTDVRAEPTYLSPKRWLQMITSANTFQVTSDNLGWHSDYDNAWISSGDSVQDAGGINASVTSITVTDADGVGGWGFSPRFSPGNLIKIESEYCSVVKRGSAHRVTCPTRVNCGLSRQRHSYKRIPTG